MTTLKSHSNTLTRRNTVQYAARKQSRTHTMAVPYNQRKRRYSLWKLAKWTCYALLAYQVYGGITQMIQDVTLASDQYKLEPACVREKIALGIERIDIATKDGKCWVEDNGYYNYH